MKIKIVNKAVVSAKPQGWCICYLDDNSINSPKK
jgi:hypothetical protein